MIKNWCLFMSTIRYAFILFMSAFYVLACAKDDSPQEIVSALYKDWGHQQDNPIQKQSLTILKKYFSSDLADLLDADNKCVNEGYVCNLDFNLLWNSQDPVAEKATISLGSTSDEAIVQIPGLQNKTEKIIFKLKEESGEWKIDDIQYPKIPSLKKQLSQ